MAPTTLEGALCSLTDTNPESEPLITAFLQKALDKKSSKLISIWQASVTEIKKDVQDLGSRMTHVETKMEEIVDAHNTAVGQIQHLTAQLAQCEAEIIVLKDRSRRSNIRLRGISLSLKCHWTCYILDLLNRVPKPQHTVASLPRDVLL
ncbi:Hypothetical predicted protein [Pelobates cultripes]|uniref:Uncharacterized protein n=1 Tax=Pelobates cultripes TaxID=61616 RepID=A0AAD1RTY2_PELCU|nr:Hypothetical predicted protein [Pelobates cultripes]